MTRAVLRLAFGLVHSSIGGGIHDDIGSHRPNGFRNFVDARQNHRTTPGYESQAPPSPPKATDCAVAPTLPDRFYQTAEFSSDPFGVILFDPGSVRTGFYIVGPVAIVQIPLHCFENARFESFSRFPAQLAFDLARIDCIAAVVAGAIGNEM